jgi:hypothetical protein
MNFFAHSLSCLHDPYEVAGTALPDWLSVVDRRVRVRSRHAQPALSAPDARLRSLARGVCRHHADDDWFHQTECFVALSLQFSRELREVLADVDGMRPFFLGHIAVELLLDAELITENPARLDEYYAAIQQIDPWTVAEGVTTMTGHAVPDLARLIPQFSASRFLSDYTQDAKLWFRLNQVMRRVKLPELPECVIDWLADARREVALQRDALLPCEEVPLRRSG